MGHVKVGIGLPAAVPETDMTAKQLSSVAQLSGGRLTAGLGMGGWAADYDASGVPLTGRGALFDVSLAAIHRSLNGPGDRPRILLGGTVPASLARAATEISEGWVAPLFGLALLGAGVKAVQRAWSEAGRQSRPRIVTGRYFDLARPDTLTDAEQIHAELHRLSDAHCDQVVLDPCSGDLEQVQLLAPIIRESGTNFGERRVFQDPSPAT
jgi:alkanesulfonate monooxygenase SsuD/methylene tetrahydromethanopterin reductase-like flavin-dependent oxidoreductase (luciferase family)